jgi:Ca-activated chloride channel family protein
MTHPKLTVTPLRPAVRSDLPTTLDVLLTITPPPADTSTVRPPLNLALVLDRSGSMGERNKMTFAREAAVFAVRELKPTDRVSVIAFDDKIEVVVANAPASDAEAVVRKINGIHPRGSTALHGGWQEGARQIQANRQAEGVNRVLLLSDGLANVGEARPDVIANEVHTVATAGVSTSTLGVGDDYNENLMEAVARSGDGNYYYVESPAQLPGIFRTELNGLSATAGVDVTLALDPRAGVTVADVLTECARTPDGRLRLPNLIAGVPVRVVVRLNVPAVSGEQDLLHFRLDWHAPKDDIRQSADARLVLPAVPGPVWDGLAENAEVKEQVLLLVVAKQKQEAARAAEAGDLAAARAYNAANMRMLRAAPASPEVAQTICEQQLIDEDLDEGEVEKFKKRAKEQAYRRHTSKPVDDNK